MYEMGISFSLIIDTVGTELIGILGISKSQKASGKSTFPIL